VILRLIKKLEEWLEKGVEIGDLLCQNTAENGRAKTSETSTYGESGQAKISRCNRMTKMVVE
jgi:hypothetical protein